jgi:hypothetical protein
MPALGHKWTSRSTRVMSALLPKADMCGANANVRFGPIADANGLFALGLFPKRFGHSSLARPWMNLSA